MFTSVAVAGILILTLFAATGNAQQPSTDTDIILSMHNSERAAVGVPALVWSDDLTARAKTWAEHLAATGEFAHDPNRGTVGANIAGYNTDVAQGVQLCINERRIITVAY